MGSIKKVRGEEEREEGGREGGRGRGIEKGST